jgi:hypothetical protein
MVEDGEVVVLVADLVEVLVVDFEVVVLVADEQVDVGSIKNNKSILFLLRKSEIQWEII